MVHIIGGGVAGLLAAEALEKRGRAWRLYERAGVVGAEASGKNAGIVRSYEADPVIASVAGKSVAYYAANEPSFRKTGILLRPWEYDYDVEANETRPFSHGRFTGFFLPENGTVNPMPMLTRLATADYRYGKILYNCEVALEVKDDEIFLRLQGAQPQTLTLGSDDRVIVAAGEGCAAISDVCGAALGLISHQRTLYEYNNAAGYAGPVEWDEESGCYFRPWDQTLVATAGEQIPVPVTYARDDTPVKSEESIDLLEKQFPLLSRSELVGYRTCRRTMPLDNRPFCGADRRYSRLFWFTGLGGRGISIAPALADTLADLVCGQAPRDDLSAFSPERVLS
ncbi:MAG: FAD-dependent oxidoreductase [Turneriella sp.]